MPQRDFTDSIGRTWAVWSVPPEEKRAGWLVFETRGLKRRLMPYPSDWVDMNSDSLEALCSTADEAPPPRRLIE